MSTSIPSCVPCGCVVDWLRSCYSSSWRLFRNDSRVTRGYFYFAQPGAPHAPFPHFFGSRNWTSPEIVNPPLGEQSGKQTYRSGGLSVAFPGHTPVGTPDCFASGDTPVPLPAGVTLPAGVDGRCYLPGPAPDPVPALWLLASDQSALGDGGLLLTWPDKSFRGGNAVPSVPTSPPAERFISPLGWVGWFLASQDLRLDTPIAASADWSVFAAVYLLAQAHETMIASPASTDEGSSLGGVWIQKTRFTVGSSGGSVGWTTAGNWNSAYLLAVRSVSGVCHCRINGVELSPKGVNLPGTITLAYVGVIPSTAFATDGLQLAELRVYDMALTDQAFASIEGALRSAYGL